jgi:hypothetical protein
VGQLLGQPAALTVPLAFAVMWLVSVRTPARRPPHVDRTMVRLHVPESLELTEAAPVGPHVPLAPARPTD